MTNKGKKIWNFFKKFVQILLGFIGVHEQVINNENEEENGN